MARRHEPTGCIGLFSAAFLVLIVYALIWAALDTRAGEGNGGYSHE